VLAEEAAGSVVGHMEDMGMEAADGKDRDGGVAEAGSCLLEVLDDIDMADARDPDNVINTLD
jgi:hypothetical protein